MKLQELLDKYYKGETSLEEEKELKINSFDFQKSKVERDVFSFYKKEGDIPEDLEQSIFEKFDKQQNKGRKINLLLLRSISAAAVVLIVMSVFIKLHNARNERLEYKFLTMENALYQVAESLQPEEQEEMMVLWVDDNVEIIIY